jgi:hypothetical protein
MKEKRVWKRMCNHDFIYIDTHMGQVSIHATEDGGFIVALPEDECPSSRVFESAGFAIAWAETFIEAHWEKTHEKEIKRKASIEALFDAAGLREVER